MKMKFQSVISLLLVLTSLSSFAQQFQLYRDTSVSVVRAGQRLANAWAPGINSASIAEIDLNGDGKMDLLHLDAPANRFNTFINLGILNQSSYVYAPEYVSRFPVGQIEGWIRSFDYDNDGDMDFFTYNGGGIAVYRNDFTPSLGLQFTFITAQLQTYYGNFQTNIYASRVNAPALSDLDNDGDMDVVALSISGSFIEHHRNYSVDSTGVVALSPMRNIPNCWGYFVLTNTGNSALLPPIPNICPLTPANSPRIDADSSPQLNDLSNRFDQQTGRLRHAGSCLLVCDLDGDGDKDVLNGDILGNNLLYLQNCGTPDSAWICSQDTAFPSYDQPVRMKEMVSPHYMDLDNDGNKDLLAGSFYFASEDYQNMKYYRNTTNNQTNVFAKQSDRWLSSSMVDVGTGAHPVSFDVDQDGRLDLLVGNDYYFNGGNLSGQVAYYRNIGSGPKAEFEWVTDDFTSLSGLGLLALHLTFGDLDGDGDQDMLIGESGGQMVFMRNTAPSGASSVFVFDVAAYQGIDVGDNAAPQLIDVDRDGLLDLLIGERAGNINYFRNTGSFSNPVFSLVTSQFGSVNVTAPGSFTGFSVPRLIDRGGVYELIVGSQDGFIHHYDSIDANLNGTFRLRDSIFQGIAQPTYASPDFADVDGDAKPDLFVGVFSGGISLYTQNTSLTVQAKPELLTLMVYPNPAKQRLTISWGELAAGSDALLRVFDMTGRLVKTETGKRSPHFLEIADLVPGVYLLHVQVGGWAGKATFITY